MDQGATGSGKPNKPRNVDTPPPSSPHAAKARVQANGPIHPPGPRQSPTIGAASKADPAVAVSEVLSLLYNVAHLALSGTHGRACRLPQRCQTEIYCRGCEIRSVGCCCPMGEGQESKDEEESRRREEGREHEEVLGRDGFDCHGRKRSRFELRAEGAC